MRQTEDWNCAAFALRHLLERFNIRISGERLDAMLEPNPDKTIGATKGVSHEAICRVLRELDLRFFSEKESNLKRLRNVLPAIVNFQCEGDGHYGVAESWNDGLVIWDPWTGGNLWYSGPEFDVVWFSKLYGPRWFLHIMMDQGDRKVETKPEGEVVGHAGE